MGGQQIPEDENEDDFEGNSSLKYEKERRPKPARGAKESPTATLEDIKIGMVQQNNSMQFQSPTLPSEDNQMNPPIMLPPDLIG